MEVIRNYFTQEKATELLSVLRDYRWYVLGTAVTGYVLLKVVTRPRNLPPGPRGWPIVGSLSEIGDDIHLDGIRLQEKYGDIVCVNVFGRLV